ncbi:MAG: IS66 family insertion sequence element accessory protein TnpB, partial [Lachnospiraceae bacterium]
MLGDVSRVANIWIVTGYTDMRRGIDGLMNIIKHTYQMDPYSNAVFLFCGRRSDRIKALVYERLSADFFYPHILSLSPVLLYCLRKNVRINIYLSPHSRASSVSSSG